ncbi:MAG: hypothetical protein EPO28_09925 [Saprospiraceae bacterium]|nr:MAG: hypothetical protein EPO28_09925 [Saprospiraceae bacterium]
MRNIKTFFFILSITFFALQCKDDDGPKLPTDPYVGCCGTEPVEFTVGNAKLYVPNAFTPNGDGTNDVFFPFFNDKVSKIELFQIFSPKLALIYLALEVDKQNPSINGWNGIDADGKKYAGLFSYHIQITDDAGFSQFISGSACSIVCDTFAAVFKTKTGCFFPAQENGEGGLDASLPMLEDDCFGQ